MSNGNYVSEEFIKDYYIESYGLLIKNKSLSSANDYSESTYYIENSTSNIYDRIPLRGEFDSFNGVKPCCLDIKVNNTYIESNFSFNELKGCYAYTPKSLLAYNYNLGNQASIILNLYVADSRPYSQILDIRNTQGRFGAYINDKTLYLVIFGTTYSTNVEVTEDVWHKLGISYSFSGSTFNFSVFYDNYTDLITKTLSNFSSDLTIYIGSYYSNGNALDILFGQIMDVLLLCTDITQSDFYNITGSNFGVSKSEYYDSLGRITKEVINYDGFEALTFNHTYDKTRVSSETIAGISRSYSYNSRNYISSITDSTYGSHTYTYDSRGYLMTDNQTSYTYDSNGNILTAGNLQFVYNSTYKDRLDSVGGTSINYYSNNPYYPSSFGNMSFTYEGKRLKTVTISSTRTITYYYDSDGIRYKKHDNNNGAITETLFYYDNNKLICEIRNGVRINYLYDSNGLMYGYVSSGISYYYIKDSLGIIHGIKNASNQVLATYTYDAYGNITSQNDSTFNRIKYKGYYYDEEIGMYYLLSRYYYPYFRRFLTPDNYTYLDFENINELNLFAYCTNNPVMYSDGSGHFPILALLIGIGIGALIGGVGAGVSSYKDGNRGQALIGDIIGGALVGGALGAASTLGGLAGAGYIGLKAAAISLGVSSLASYGAGVGSYALEHTWGRNEEWNPQAAFTKGAVVAVEGYVNFVLGAAFAQTGIWNSLNKGQFGSNYSFLRSGLGPVKSFGGATAMYLAENAGQMAARFAIKTAMTFPWIYLNKYL
jgi:RHS repeat-associated protein